MNYEIKTAAPKEVATLYKKFIEPYFPACEVKPLKSILRMIQTGLYSVLYLTEGEETRGAAFLTSYPGGSIYLLDYLAVDDKYRSKGFGGLLLQACSEYAGSKPVIIETEAIAGSKNADELAKRRRRNSFYAQNGAIQSGVNTCIFGMIYDNWTLCKGEKPSAEAVQKGLENIYKFMVSDPEMYRANVFIPYII